MVFDRDLWDDRFSKDAVPAFPRPNCAKGTLQYDVKHFSKMPCELWEILEHITTRPLGPMSLRRFRYTNTHWMSLLGKSRMLLRNWLRS